MLLCPNNKQKKDKHINNQTKSTNTLFQVPQGHSQYLLRGTQYSIYQISQGNANQKPRFPIYLRCWLAKPTLI